MILDNHGRPVNYLRLAVTDRCNLRCFYCMPEEGIDYLPKKELLTYEEMTRLVTLLVNLGVNKIRLTGGEPFLRRDLMPFLRKIAAVPGMEEINITTNGVLTAPHVKELKILGIRSVNLSLDTLDRERFRKITRRDEFDRVMETFHLLLEQGIAVKINAVVMEGQNTQDLIPLAELSRDYPVSVRFIEEMPFNGKGNHYPVLVWDHIKIVETLKQQFSDLHKIPDGPGSTSYNYAIPGHQGTVGVIAAYSRTFCGTCNRIRITAQGSLKTCLYDKGVLDLRHLLRSGASDQILQEALINAFTHRAKNGFEAEEQSRFLMPTFESMSTIGG